MSRNQYPNLPSLNSNGYDYKALDIEDEGKYYPTPDSLHPETEAVAFEVERAESMKRNVKRTFTRLKNEMQSSRLKESSKAASEINFDTLIDGKTTTALSKGRWWNYKKKGWFGTEIQFQRGFTWLMTKTTIGAQWSEPVFVIGNIVLSIYSADDPGSSTFYVPLSLTAPCAPGAIEMNWNFTTPEDDVPDAIRPAQFCYDIPTYENEKKLIFNCEKTTGSDNRPITVERDIYTTSMYKNEADVAFHRVVLRYSKYEPNNSYPKLNYINSWAVEYSRLCNHLLGPFGNWTAIGYVTSTIDNVKTKLGVGLATLIPVEIAGASYYQVTNEPLLKEVEESYISSKNPVARASRIANFPAFLMGFLEWIFSSGSRATGVAITALVAYEYLGVEDISADDFNQLSEWTTYLGGLGVLLFSLYVRGARSFSPITKPLTFETPFGDTQIITNVKILDTFGAHTYVKSQFSGKDRNYLIIKSAVLSSCWTLLPFVTLLYVDPEAAVPLLAVMLPTIGLSYYFGDKANLLRDRAGKVIGVIRGRSPFSKLTGEQIRFAYFSVGSDAIPRTLSKSGGITAVAAVKELFLQTIGMSNAALLFLSALFMIPSAKVDVLYFLAPMLKHSPRFIKDWQYATRRRINDGTKDGKPKTWPTSYLTQGIAIAAVKAAPCLFREKTTQPAPDFKPLDIKDITAATNSIDLNEVERKLEEEKNKGCLTRIKQNLYALICRPSQPVATGVPLQAVVDAYIQVTQDEKHFSASTQLTSWFPCFGK